MYVGLLAGLKMKLIGSLVAISVILLLKDFVDAGTKRQALLTETKLKAKGLTRRRQVAREMVALTRLKEGRCWGYAGGFAHLRRVTP